MKDKFIYVWAISILTLLLSCGHKPAEKPIESKPLVVTTATENSESITKPRLVFHLAGGKATTLLLEHKQNSQQEKLKLEKIFEVYSLKKGQWRLKAVLQDGKKYELKNKSHGLTFSLKNAKDYYGGSWVLECPKVDIVKHPELKKFSFFNRYLVISSNESCELVVGNDLVRVNRAWKKLSNQHQALIKSF